MSCDLCKKLGACTVDPTACDQYTLDPDKLLLHKLNTMLVKVCGVKKIETNISGSAISIKIHAEHIMCDNVSRDLYNSIVGRILQEVLDETDGALQVEYASTIVVDVDLEEPKDDSSY